MIWEADSAIFIEKLIVWRKRLAGNFQRHFNSNKRSFLKTEVEFVKYTIHWLLCTTSFTRKSTWRYYCCCFVDQSVESGKSKYPPRFSYIVQKINYQALPFLTVVWWLKATRWAVTFATGLVLEELKVEWSDEHPHPCGYCYCCNFWCCYWWWNVLLPFVQELELEWVLEWVLEKVPQRLLVRGICFRKVSFASLNSHVVEV